MARVRVKPNNGVGELGGEGVRPQINHESVVEIVRYKECMHNHAASIGYYTIDGCGEFLKGGEDGSPKALLCAACECHRSFHRKEVLFHDDTTKVWYLHRPVTIAAAPNPLPPRNILLFNLRAPPLSQQQNGVWSEKLRGGETEVEMERRKKPRTKLTKEQKEGMSAFAERVGWKSHRHNDEEIRKFCSDIGISRRVFKVWSNNNRYGKEATLPPLSSASPPPQPPSSPPPPMSPLLPPSAQASI